MINKLQEETVKMTGQFAEQRLHLKTLMEDYETTKLVNPTLQEELANIIKDNQDFKDEVHHLQVVIGYKIYKNAHKNTLKHSIHYKLIMSQPW